MYTIKNVKTDFKEIRFKTPLVIREEKIEDITLADVTVSLTNEEKSAEGRSQVLLSDVWSMPDSKLSHFHRDYLMRTILNTKQAMSINKYNEFLDPLNHHLNTYKETLNIGSNLGLPELAVDNSISAFDLALWDAFAKINDKNNVYECLDGIVFSYSSIHGIELNRLDMDIEWVEEINYGFNYKEYFHKPNNKVRVLHTFGGKDKIESLEEYVKKEEINAVKIKLKGNANEDVKRVKEVVELLSGYGDNFTITVDPNESYECAESLAIFLDRLRTQEEYSFNKLQYVEQPTSRNLDASNQNMRYLVKEFKKPIVMDEMVSDHEKMSKAIELGWNGIALKPTAKIFSETLLELIIAKDKKLFICVQDLTNPGLALIQHLDFARRVVVENEPVETNARQYLQEDIANTLMPNKNLTSLYNVANGMIDVSVINNL